MIDKQSLFGRGGHMCLKTVLKQRSHGAEEDAGIGLASQDRGRSALFEAPIKTERVYARIFRRQDRGRLVVTLLDRREEPEAWDLSVDLSTVGAGELGDVTLRKLDGSEEALAATVSERKALIRIPGFEGRVAALPIGVSPERKAP
jgi:hypothetical protein